jgi:uncharacterized protein (TIGR01440 family)
MTEIEAATRRSLRHLLSRAKPRPGSLLVIGCSTSVVVGKEIGKGSSVAVAEEILAAVLAETTGLRLAFQCCEHLNRALVVTDDGPGIGRRVEAFPVPGAGGTLAAVAMLALDGAHLVERVEADLGLDIGSTLIGMHLRPVVVPVPMPEPIGAAHVSAGFSRPPLIGGARAVYTREEAERAVRAGR